jgi:Predicted ABC-type transport system involved in lysophospholipase L1 biosynthesis, permease component
LIGGDVVIVSDHPLKPLYLQHAQAQGCALCRRRCFPSMALDITGDRTRLVSLKAVGAHYPLIAQVVLRDGLQAPEVSRSGPPEPGTVG